jgi:hypothetical protein
MICIEISVDPESKHNHYKWYLKASHFIGKRIYVYFQGAKGRSLCISIYYDCSYVENVFIFISKEQRGVHCVFRYTTIAIT